MTGDPARRVLRQPALGAAVPIAPRPRPLPPEALAAIEAARAEGHAQAMADARRAATEDDERLAAAVNHAIETALQVHRDERAAEAAATVELALRIAREVAGATIDDHGHALAARIRTALALVDDAPVVVEVAPDRVERLRAALSDRRGVEVAGDARLGRDEARVSGPWSSADLTAEARWSAVEQAVRA